MLLNIHKNMKMLNNIHKAHSFSSKKQKKKKKKNNNNVVVACRRRIINNNNNIILIPSPCLAPRQTVWSVRTQ